MTPEIPPDVMESLRGIARALERDLKAKPYRGAETGHLPPFMTAEGMSSLHPHNRDLDGGAVDVDKLNH